jgi:hypothetical protein
VILAGCPKRLALLHVLGVVSRSSEPAPTRVKLPRWLSETARVLLIETKYTNKKQSKKNSSRSKNGEEVRRHFHFNHATTISNGSAAANLDLNGLEAYAEDFAQLSDMYRYFRINKFSVTAWVDMTAGTGNELLYAIYHAPNGTGATPFATGLEGKYAMGHAWMNDAAAGLAGKNAKLVLTKDDLTTISPWFVTLNDTAGGADMDGPGVLAFTQATTMTNAGTLLYEVEMDITFRTILDPETVSAAAEKRVLDRMDREARVKLGKLGEPQNQQAAPPAAAIQLRRR